MTIFAHALNTALLHFVWQGVAGAVLLGLVSLILRKRSPHSRYLASCVILAAMSLAPVATGIVALQSFTSAEGAAPLTARPASLATTAMSTAANSLASVSRTSFESWILPLWGIGVIGFALRLAWAGGHASSLVREGVQPDVSLQGTIDQIAERVGVRRYVRVLLSSIADVPSVVGWIRPVILLPVSVVVGLSPVQLEALIAHELAHVRRYDYFVNILQMVAETLLFYHPAVWWVSSRIRYERELCCDDLAVGACGDAVSYARALAQLERLRPATSLAMGSANGPLYHRIQGVLRRDNTERGPSALACVIGVLAVVICLALGISTADAQQEDLTPLMKQLAVLQVPAAPSLPVRLPSGAVIVVARPVASLSPLRAQEQITSSLTALQPLPPPPVGGGVLFQEAQAKEAEDSHWVLFVGTDVTVRGNASDEAAARRARQSMTGDMMWFIADGKAYVTQDKEILERMRASPDVLAFMLGRMGRQAMLQERSIQAQVEHAQAQLNAQSHAVDDLARKLRELEVQARSQQLSPDMAREIERALQKQIESLKAATAEMHAQTAAREVELSKAGQQLRDQSRELERLNRARETPPQQGTRDLEILREAVRSGRAQAAP